MSTNDNVTRVKKIHHKTTRTSARNPRPLASSRQRERLHNWEDTNEKGLGKSEGYLSFFTNPMTAILFLLTLHCIDSSAIMWPFEMFQNVLRHLTPLTPLKLQKHWKLLKRVTPVKLLKSWQLLTLGAQTTSETLLKPSESLWNPVKLLTPFDTFGTSACETMPPFPCLPSNPATFSLGSPPYRSRMDICVGEDPMEPLIMTHVQERSSGSEGPFALKKKCPTNALGLNAKLARAATAWGSCSRFAVFCPYRGVANVGKRAQGQVSARACVIFRF